MKMNNNNKVIKKMIKVALGIYILAQDLNALVFFFEINALVLMLMRWCNYDVVWCNEMR
jgi:hypothetical protein